MTITSIQNEKVKFWTGLKLKKNRDKHKCFLIEGDHLIAEAKKKNLIIETISLNDPTADYQVTKEIMAKISEQKSISSDIAVVKYIPNKEIIGNILILDDIQDPGNLGTLIRTSIAFNFPNIILSNNSVDLYNSKVIRATEGMIFQTNVIRTDLKDAINKLKEDNYTIIGTDVLKGKEIKNISAKNYAIILGNEGNGVNKEINDLSDYLVNIKMSKNIESLNVGIAGSILMYEVYNGRTNNSR